MSVKPEVIMVTKRLNLLLVIPALMYSFLSFAQTKRVVITGGTVHTGKGNVIEGGRVVFQHGVIVEVVPKGKEVTGNDTDLEIINAEGKHIYPGIICLNTQMGLNEIDAVRATRDYAETGSVNPNARALVAFNTDSKILPTAAFNGVMMVQAVPSGGLVSGQSSLMKTVAWNWEDAGVRADDGIHINWPELYPWGDVAKQMERVAHTIQQLDDLFAQAAQYCNTRQPEEINLRLEAMRGLFNGTKKLFIHVSGAEGIVRSVQFFNRYKEIQKVLVGAEGAYEVVDFIRDNNIPVVLNLMHRLPTQGHDDIDMPYKLPALLMKAGIKTAIANGGSWESRNVVFNAGTAAAHGLSKEEALMCITSNAAEICGAGSVTGSVETGKYATLVISDGDILDMKSNQIRYAFINGERIDLVNQQQQLYLKYLNKYGIK